MIAMIRTCLLLVFTAISINPALSQKPSAFTYTLSDSTTFNFWTDSTDYHTTYYVDQNHPEASDKNPGTQEQPFRTINQAASMAQPGEKIMIRSGEYHEQIHPRHEGKSSSQMIRYQAYPGEEVTVTGSRSFTPEWEQSIAPSGKKVSFYLWQAKLDSSMFTTDPNPFFTPNASGQEMELMHWATDWKNHSPFTLGRGIIFQNNRRMIQMTSYMDLLKQPGTFWIDTAKKRIHIHPYNKDNPHQAQFEITTLQQLVVPPKQGMGYIALEGITFEHAANGFPRVGTGAVYTKSGHHWIIENCTIRNVNSVGIEIGARMHERPETTPAEEKWINQHPGGTIVRNNHVYQCGTGGIQGHTNKEVLVYGNHLHDIGWQHIEVYWECAAIKLLRCDHSLVAHNTIHHITDAAGIWLDWDNKHSRVTRNVLYNIPKTFNGGIYIEASRTPNLIDHNILRNVRKAAINLAYTDHCKVFHNLVMNGDIPVNSIVYNQDRKQDGETLSSKRNTIQNNVFYHNRELPIIKNDTNTCNQNLYAIADSSFASWQNKGWDTNSANLSLNITTHETLSDLHITCPEPFPKTGTVPFIKTDFFHHPRSPYQTAAGPFEKSFVGTAKWKVIP